LRISLLVGASGDEYHAGLGHERRREIGIRKPWALEKGYLGQFLVELRYIKPLPGGLSE
jgi:hypothetical protein